MQEERSKTAKIVAALAAEQEDVEVGIMERGKIMWFSLLL